MASPPAYAISTIYAAIKAAAMAGKPAPSSRTLAVLIGAKSPATAQYMVDRLIVAGRIRVVSTSNSRVISCSQGEWKTAELPHPPKSTQNKKRVFTEDEDDVIRASRAGKIRVDAAITQLKTSPASFYRRMAELGLQKLEYSTKRSPLPVSKTGEEPARAAHGWIPIAHGGMGKWREYEGTPISIDAAHAAVAAGRGSMAQRRIDGEFDLLFKSRA